MLFGLLGFVGDETDGPVGAALVALAGSGPSWGAVALVAGYTRRRRRAAVGLAVATLTVAVLAYYLSIVAFSRRWRGQTRMDDGMLVSASHSGLVSIGRAAVFWIVVAIVAGALLGLLGYEIRWGSATSAALAAAAAVGLLAGHGIDLVRPALTRVEWSSHLGGLAATGVVYVVISVVAVTVLFVRQPGPKAWRVFVPAALVGLVLAGELWHQAMSIRHS